MPFILMLLVDLILILFHGLVLKVLWGWFMVPQFGLPSLSVASAIGISAVMLMFTYRSQPKSDEEVSEKVSRIITDNLISIIFALVVGWIAAQFM